MADAQTALRLTNGGGGLTAANVNTAPRDIQVSWYAEHWLHVTSGGSDSCPWRWLAAATFAAFFFDVDAVGDILLCEQALHLDQISGAFRTALDNGMDATTHRGGLFEALHYFVMYCRSVRASHRAAFTFDEPADFFTLPNGQGANPPDECRWYERLQIAMGVHDGDALALAWVINLLPGCWIRAGRRESDFMDAAGDLLDAAATTNQRLLDDTTPYRRKAAGVMAFLLTAIPSAVLFRPVATRDVLQVIQSFRLSPKLQFKAHFLGAWQFAFPHLLSLLTSNCGAREAFAHVTALLSDAPTEELVVALDERVSGLLAYVDTAALRDPDASIQDRVAAIRDQLSKKARPSSAKYADDHPDFADTSSEHTAKLLNDDDAKDLIAVLEPLDTTPFVAYRVVREALGHKHPAGAILLNGVHIDYPLFKSFKRCAFAKNEDPLIEAFRRRMCVDSTNALRLDWFHCLNIDNKPPKLPLMLAKGNFAAGDRLVVNFWLHLIQPLLRARRHAAFVPSHISRLAEADPSAMFSDEYMLREGTPILVSAFGFIAVAPHGQHSIRDVLDTCADRTKEVNAIPDKLVDPGGQTFTWATAKSSIRNRIRAAAVAGFCEFAGHYRAMLLTPPHLAARPTPFAPEAGAFYTGVDKVDELMQPIVKQVKLADISGAVQPDNNGAPPLAIPTGPTRGVISHAAASHLSPSALALATGAHVSVGPPQSSKSPSASSRGSLLNTTQTELNGVWFNTPYGARWCSAVGPRPLDVNRVCIASLTPPGLNPDDYCNKGPLCNHRLPDKYTATHSPTGPPADSKQLKSNDSGKGGGGGRRDGKGGKGGRQQRGRGRSF